MGARALPNASAAPGRICTIPIRKATHDSDPTASTLGQPRKQLRMALGSRPSTGGLTSSPAQGNALIMG